METIIQEKLQIVAGYKIYITGFFLLLVLLESIDLYQEKKLQAKENFTNLKVFLIGNILQNFVFKKMQYLILMLFVPYRLFDLGISWQTFALAFIATDLTYYWKHRFEHINRFYWAEHSVHHSSKVFNLTSALRLPWFAPLFSWPFFLPLVFIGFHPALILTSLLLNLFYQYFIHTEKVGRLGVFEYIFNTPSLHRVHHAQNVEYWDKNFGGVFIFWDLLFGTYQHERSDIKIFYGVKEYQHLENPFTININPYLDFFKTVSWKIRSLVLIIVIFALSTQHVQAADATLESKPEGKINCQQEIAKTCPAQKSLSELNSCIDKNEKNISSQCVKEIKSKKDSAIGIAWACRSDRAKFCSQTTFGSGDTLACFEKHFDKLSESCQKKLREKSFSF